MEPSQNLSPPYQTHLSLRGTHISISQSTNCRVTSLFLHLHFQYSFYHIYKVPICGLLSHYLSFPILSDSRTWLLSQSTGSSVACRLYQTPSSKAHDHVIHHLPSTVYWKNNILSYNKYFLSSCYVLDTILGMEYTLQKNMYSQYHSGAYMY